MNPYLEMARPVNSLMSGLAAVIGFLVASGMTLNGGLTSMLMLFASACLFSAASMAINDYFDREIDAINQPHRPIPSGRVTPRGALCFSIALMAVGFTLASVVGLLSLLVAVLACAVFTAYSARLKRMGLLGNAAVSLCVALTFIYGSTGWGYPTALIALFSLMAFLANMSREVVKGVVDVEGDSAKGVRTLAVVVGLRGASMASLVFMASAVAISVLPYVLGYVNQLYLPLISVADVGLLASSCYTALKPTPHAAKRAKNLMLIFMCIALAAFLAGSAPS